MNMESYQKQFRPPELFGDFWLNSEPVSVRDMRGNVLLIDFWDYSSLHWIRTLPYVWDWEQKYRDYGLVVVGVHTPEFAFGREEQNVRKAVQDFGISYPVVGDNNANIWNSFGSRTWPTKFLIDKDGFIRCMHQGEGGYDQFERAIQFLITEAGMRGELPELTMPVRDTDVQGAICYRTTGEIRTGYLRGAIGNTEGFGPESTFKYVDQGMYLPGRFYLDGKWTSERESVRFAGGQKEHGTVSARYEGSEVNAVLGLEGKKKCRVMVQQDGKWLKKSNRGSDITVGKDGSTYVMIDRFRMFNLVKNSEFGEHAVRLSTHTAGLKLFCFSFTTSVIPEAMNAPQGIELN